MMSVKIVRLIPVFSCSLHKHSLYEPTTVFSINQEEEEEEEEEEQHIVLIGGKYWIIKETQTDFRGGKTKILTGKNSPQVFQGERQKKKVQGELEMKLRTILV